MRELTVLWMPTTYCASVVSVSCSMLAKIGNAKPKKRKEKKLHVTAMKILFRDYVFNMKGSFALTLLINLFKHHGVF